MRKEAKRKEANKMDFVEHERRIKRLVAESLNKKELEEHYVKSLEIEKRRPLSYGIIICCVIIFLMGIILFSEYNSYPDTEYDNYRYYSRWICENENYGRLRYLSIEEDEIIVDCTAKEVSIKKEE